MIATKIIELAQADLGIQEIPGNKGWEDKAFQDLLIARGWLTGQSWCMLWAEKIWVGAYKDHPEVIKVIYELFSASAVTTYSNVLKSGYFKADKQCSPGSIVIWQHWENGKATWKGHAGIVLSETCSQQFRTIEGNSNAAGGREGKEVAPKLRRLDFNARTGLVLKGFLHPKEV